MLWILISSVLVLIGALGSIWARFDAKRDLASGHPTFDTLGWVTGRWDHEYFVQNLGEPDSSGRFSATADQVHQLATARFRFFDHPVFDWFCMLAAIFAPILWYIHSLSACVLALLNFSLMCAAYAWAARITYKAGAWKRWLQESK